MFYPLIGSVGLLLLIFLIVALLIHIGDRKTSIDLNRGRRNFKVRYEPTKHKYYLTNATNYGDIDVCRFGLFRVYYKSKIDADLVMQKLNDYQ